MQEKLQELQTRLRTIHDLNAAGSVLGWDQSTYMPPGGGPARARQMSTLRRLTHEKATDPALGRLLEELASYGESLPYDSDEASLIRVARRDYDREIRIPTEFVARSSRHRAESFHAWKRARPENDFAAVRPHLETALELSRERANFFPGYVHIADPLIDLADYGMTVAALRELFAALREQLVPMVQAITAQRPADDTCLRQHFAPEQKLAFGRMIAARLGYDFKRGREDLAPHPFTTSFSIGDVRITTRVDPDHFSGGLFATMHESGHAMYQQGIDPAHEGTPLARGTSSGVHESQSRLWENVVGRSRGFWEHFYPRLQETFPGQLGSVPLETFYRAINKVQPGLIRVHADEVTYNLHIIIRFDLELAMLEGRLAIADLPAAWRERYEADLGIVPPDDRDGAMQDMHWYSGSIGGGFQGYTLGNILSAQFYEAAVAVHPEIPGEIAQGEFGTLFAWLVENIYRHGRKFTPAELVERVTGRPMHIEPYIHYLRGKYGELYALG